MTLEDDRNIGLQWYSPDRREVLKGMTAAALIGTGILNSHTGNAATIEARAASAKLDASHGLTWLPAWRLREMIVKREVSSVEVVEHFLKRIESLDPQLHAFRKVDAQAAREEAARADQALKAGAAPGLLHGVPIAMKELFFVKGFPVPGSYYSYLASGKSGPLPLAERDDIEVERLRAAGAIIVGITVAAGGLAPGMTDASQLPRNPWDTSRTSGSTSAGNGAAVAGGLLPLAIGDDAGGSVRVPAAFCGLVGLHPTRGRIPHVDYKSAAPRPTVTVGPMTRDVHDAAVALQVLAGPDGRDFVCLQDTPPDYLAALDFGIKGKRFAWTEDFGFASIPDALQSPRTVSAIHAATRLLEQAGGRVAKAAMSWENPLPSWLAAQQLANGTLVPGLAARDLSEKEIVAAFESRQRNWQRFQKTFAEYDFVISPTAPFTAPKMQVWVKLWKEQGGDPKHTLAIDVLAAQPMMCNVLGIPAISVPAGFVDRMPVGMQVIGKAGSESQLLQVAQAFLARMGNS